MCHTGLGPEHIEGERPDLFVREDIRATDFDFDDIRAERSNRGYSHICAIDGVDQASARAHKSDPSAPGHLQKFAHVGKEATRPHHGMRDARPGHVAHQGLARGHDIEVD
jgi:hypothetical protein